MYSDVIEYSNIIFYFNLYRSYVILKISFFSFFHIYTRIRNLNYIFRRKQLQVKLFNEHKKGINFK